MFPLWIGAEGTEATVSLRWHGIALAEIRDRRPVPDRIRQLRGLLPGQVALQNGKTAMRVSLNRCIPAIWVLVYKLWTNRPTHESKAAPLVGFSLDQALQAWETAAEHAAGRRITAQIVKSAVRGSI